MFEKFGEFDSAEELNRAAEAQRAEGDEEALKLLAKENGIDEEEAKDYMDGINDTFVTPLMAAVGKIEVEAAELKIGGVLNDWKMELVDECTKSPGMARAVRKKGKTLVGFMALLADAGFKEKTVVDKEIVKRCAKEIRNIVGNHEFYIGIPDKKTRRELMRKYYLGEE